MTLAAAPTRPDFWSHGACVDLPAEWFHPERGESTTHAKAVCRACVVRVECLTWALSNCERFGIWGGTSERERRRIRRRLAAGEPVAELIPSADDDHAGPDRLIITPPEEEPTVDLTVVDPPAPGPTNGVYTQACDNCGKAYVPVRCDQRFHSKECAWAWYSSHPRGASGKREPRIRKARAVDVPVTKKADPIPAPTLAAPTPAVPTPPAGPVDLQVLVGQLLAGCDRWHIEADVGDIHLTITRAVP